MSNNYYSNKNIFITGGAGLIGSSLTDILVEKGANVTVLDNLYRGKKEYIKQIKNINFLESDLLSINSYAQHLEKADIVFHVASKVLGIGYSVKNHSEMMFYNDKINNAFFDYLANSNRLQHLIVISSSCIYDDNGPDMVPESYGFTGTPEKANLGYGLAKRFLEEKSQIFANEKKIKLTIFRPFNIYGENYTWAGENSQALPSLVKKVMDNNGKIEIWGSGNQCRNYLHSFDCANIMLKISSMQKDSTDIFNIGINETISLKNLVTTICNLYKIKSSLTFNTNMPEGRFIKSCDDSKLLKYLPNFKKELITLEEGLLRMYKWYNKNFN